MRTLFRIGFASAALLHAAELPPAARQILDVKHPGWTIAPVAPQIATWFREYGFSYDPSLAALDFDSDSRADYAVQLVEGKRQITIALLARGSGYEYHRLADDAVDRFTYLLLNPKGSLDFDFTTLKKFRHATDSVNLMYFTRLPLNFSWRNGAFVKRDVPNDEE